MNWHSEEYTSFTLDVVLKARQWDEHTYQEIVQRLSLIADLIQHLVPDKLIEFHAYSHPRFAAMPYGVVLPYQVSAELSSLRDMIVKLEADHPTKQQ